MQHDPAPSGTTEPSAFTAARPPLPRRSLGRGTLALLLLLRVYIAIAVPIVGYAFFHALAAHN